MSVNFGKLSGEELEAALLRLRAGERRLEVQVLLGLIELDRRKLYLDWGYASLFSYCVERLGYCESSAGRRIAAARAMKRIPRIEGMLLSGEARLSTVARAAGELERDETVLEEIRGKTQREVEEVLARRGYNPRKRDHLRAVSEAAWEFRFSAGGALREKFERARALLSKKHPEGVAFEQVFEAALDEYLKRHDPAAAAESKPIHSPRRSGPPSRSIPAERRPAAAAPEPSPAAHSPGGSDRHPAKSEAGELSHWGRSRSVPTEVRRAVWRRDGGRCAYLSAGGRRCGSTWNLEVDHVHPFSRGGAHREENLRLLCEAHNRREAERILGRAWMRQFYCLRE